MCDMCDLCGVRTATHTVTRGWDSVANAPATSGVCDECQTRCQTCGAVIDDAEYPDRCPRHWWTGEDAAVSAVSLRLLEAARVSRKRQEVPND